MKGNKIKLKIGNSYIAAATNATVNMNMSLDEVTPIPGTELDDGWEHFRPTIFSWSVSHDGLFTSSNCIDTLLESDVDAEMHIDSLILSGTLSLEEVSITANYDELTKISCKLRGNQMPNIY